MNTEQKKTFEEIKQMHVKDIPRYALTLNDPVQFLELVDLVVEFWRKDMKERLHKEQHEKHRCACGSLYTHMHKDRHMRGEKHKKWFDDHELKINDIAYS
jgi:hypothetical protein